MEIVEFPVTDTAEAISVENGTAANVRIFSAGDYQPSVFHSKNQVDTGPWHPVT